MNSINYDLNERKQTLKAVISDAGEKISCSPEGYLKIISGRFYYCKNSLGDEAAFIPAGNYPFIKKLALKDYYTEIMNLAYLEYASLENGKLYSGEKFEDVYRNLPPLRKSLIENEHVLSGF